MLTTRNISALICLLVLAASVHGQNVREVIVRSISLDGNDRTKDFVILRELDFEVGDTIDVASMQQRFMLNEHRILNTRLFVQCALSAREWRRDQSHMDIKVSVRESWYLIPTPVVKFVDRNIHVWWNEQNRDFSRLIFGLRGRHYNLTGVGDQLRLNTEVGFRRRLTLDYRIPYINKARTLGMVTVVDYNSSRNGAYATVLDEIAFINDGEQTNFESLSAHFQLNYRPGLLVVHEFGASFFSERVSDDVIGKNPLFHHNGNRVQRFFDLNYKFSYEGRDRRLQANNGIYLQGEIVQRGLGIYDDVLFGYVDLQAKYYHSLSRRFVMRHSAAVRSYYLTDKLPYNQVIGLGRDDRYVRGYEAYVVDGTDYVMVHNGLRYLALEKTMNLSKVLPVKKAEVIPIKIFASLNADFGYAADPGYESNNTLDDTWLYGLGPSIELLLAESFLFGIDYSYNHLGETGVYLHTRFNF